MTVSEMIRALDQIADTAAKASVHPRLNQEDREAQVVSHTTATQIREYLADQEELDTSFRGTIDVMALIGEGSSIFSN